MSAPQTRAALGRAPPPASPATGKRYGVVIGINEHKNSALNLRYAREDASALYALMIDPECGTFAAENVRLLLDADATREGMRSAMADLADAGPDDEVWIYYAGHAAKEDGVLYWVAHDTDVNRLFKSGFPPTEIERVLQRVQSRRVLVMLDCCHAAAMQARTVLTRDVLTREDLLRQFDGTGRITLSASSGDQRSVELPDKGHGAFTWFLIEGMRGAADPDGEGVVTADGLWHYLNGKVREAARQVGVAQTPVRQGEASHDFRVTLNPRMIAHRRELVAEVKRRIGVEEGQISTEEGRRLIRIIEEGPQTPQDQQILKDLEDVAAGKLETGVFVRLLRPEGSAPAQEAPPAAAPPKAAPPKAAPPKAAPPKAAPPKAAPPVEPSPQPTRSPWRWILGCAGLLIGAPLATLFAWVLLREPHREVYDAPVTEVRCSARLGYCKALVASGRTDAPYAQWQGSFRQDESSPVQPDQAFSVVDPMRCSLYFDSCSLMFNGSKNDGVFFHVAFTSEGFTDEGYIPSGAIQCSKQTATCVSTLPSVGAWVAEWKADDLSYLP